MQPAQLLFLAVNNIRPIRWSYYSLQVLQQVVGDNPQTLDLCDQIHKLVARMTAHFRRAVPVDLCAARTCGKATGSFAPSWMTCTGASERRCVVYLHTRLPHTGELKATSEATSLLSNEAHAAAVRRSKSASLQTASEVCLPPDKTQRWRQGGK